MNTQNEFVDIMMIEGLMIESLMIEGLMVEWLMIEDIEGLMVEWLMIERLMVEWLMIEWLMVGTAPHRQNDGRKNPILHTVGAAQNVLEASLHFSLCEKKGAH